MRTAEAGQGSGPDTDTGTADTALDTRTARRRRRRAAVLYGGTTALALTAPRCSARLRRTLPPAVADTAVLAAAVATGWATIAWWERRAPFRPDWNRARPSRRREVTTDLADLVVSGALAQLVAGALVRPVRARIGARPGGGPLARLPLPARVGVLLLGFDLGHSQLHRTLHERSWAWRFHAPHHSPTRLYWFNATRFHPIESAIDGTQELLLLCVLGVDAPTRLAYQVFRGIFGQIQHANIDLDSGPMRWVLSTPERHRWHHSADPAEGNANYGAVVAVWDLLLGSSFTPDRPFDAEVGNGDPGYPTSWAGQLLAPFR